LRLLLDEHYSPRIAEQLRREGYDAVAVSEHAELIGVSDSDLVGVAAAERRALVTENVADFVELARQLAARGEDHYGLIFTSPTRFPRSRATVGLFVRELGGFLRARGEDDALLNQVHWLDAT
jgi:Domain of unknown function (DUF5615)